jgi:hypothetical protein
MNSRRCNLRTNKRQTPSTLEGLTRGKGPVRPFQGRQRFLGVHVRRLHVRLFTVSRFAGLPPSVDLANQLRKDGGRKPSKKPEPDPRERREGSCVPHRPSATLVSFSSIHQERTA